MARVRDIVAEAVRGAAHRLDADTVRTLYAAVSVPVDVERDRLRRAGRPFLDPARPEAPEAAVVRATAERLVEQATFRATALGGAAGLGGVGTLPPEVVATLVAIVRLGQRLAIVYGFDPDTDRGQVALRQALSAGLEVELPPAGLLGLRVTDLPRALAPRVAGLVTVDMAGALLRRTARLVVGRVGRFIPGVSVGVGAIAGRHRMRAVGHRMLDALERQAELPLDRRAGVVEALEVAAPTGGDG
jgi:hypothetical protein